MEISRELRWKYYFETTKKESYIVVNVSCNGLLMVSPSNNPSSACNMAKKTLKTHYGYRQPAIAVIFECHNYIVESLAKLLSNVGVPDKGGWIKTSEEDYEWLTKLREGDYFDLFLRVTKDMSYIGFKKKYDVLRFKEWLKKKKIKHKQNKKNKMESDSKMPFGVHKGKKLANVPASYLLWLFDNNKCFGSLKNYIRSNLEVLREEVKKK